MAEERGGKNDILSFPRGVGRLLQLLKDLLLCMCLVFVSSREEVFNQQELQCLDVFSVQVMCVQIKCFHEIITIGYNVYHSYDLPWFRTLSW